QAGTATGPGPLHRRLGCFIDGKNIVAVHDDARDAIAHCPVGDVLHGGCGPVGSGGSVLVVLTDKDSRQLKGGSHVHTLMEGTPVGGTIAKEADGHLIGFHQFGRQGGPYRQVITAPDHTVGPQHADGKVGDVHGAALAAAVAGSFTIYFRHHFLQVRTLGNGVAVAPVGTGNVVVLAQDSTDPGGNGFFTDVEVDKARDLSSQKEFIDPLFK